MLLAHWMVATKETCELRVGRLPQAAILIVSSLNRTKAMRTIRKL